MEDKKTFSEREQEVVKLLLQGMSNKQIALELGISTRTIEFHLSNIYAKLDVTSRTEAILRLTEGNLRESTGDRSNVSLRESTVDEYGKGAENVSKPIFQRRIPMKNVLPILGAMLTTTAVALLVIFTNHPGGTAEKMVSGQDKKTAMVETTTVASTETSLPTPAPAYKYAAPNSISAGDLKIEVSPRLSASVLEFTVIATYPQKVEFEEPEFLFVDLEIQMYRDDLEIRVDEQAGGGGGGPGIQEQVVVFNVNQPLEMGQIVHVRALVTFDEAFGFSEPIPFELELTVGEPFPLRGQGGG
jgi:DNA-binding CsgD family transcriptional regulator